MTLDDPKTALRARARAARRAMAPDARGRANASICRKLLQLPELEGAASVLAYAASPEEADPALAVEELRARGRRVAMPRIEAPGELSLRWVDAGDALEEGPFGLRQPSDAASRADAGAIEASIVPGVAFGRDGSRLGYGGGYYDRLLKILPLSAPKVGIAFESQLFDSLPSDVHDVAVDIVVTQNAVVRPPGREPRGTG